MIPETRGAPRWRAALFDLDGTLVDTRPGMRAALEAALVEVTGEATSVGRADFSLPLEDMIRSVDPATPAPARRELAAAFRRHYDAGCWAAATLCAGAGGCVRDLDTAGVRLFVVTNKRTSAALRLLERFDLARAMERVVGQPETGTPRPKSELAGRCLAESGLDPAETLVVGDSDHDAAMAATWGMMFVAVTSGAGPLSPASAEAERVDVDSLADAAAFLLLHSQGGRREP